MKAPGMAVPTPEPAAPRPAPQPDPQAAAPLATGLSRRRWLLAGGTVLATLPVAELLRPRRMRARELGPLDPARDLPASFGNWQEDRSLRPLLPDPTQQAVLDATYTAVLARTLQRRQDAARVMLSVAYGEDQGSEATQVHRPEYCYQGQGFAVRSLGTQVLPLDGRGHALVIERLFAQQGPRQEPISYWLMLGEQATLPGLSRRLAQWREGLSGWIADGLVFRLSSFGPADEASFALHAECARALFAATPQAIRARYFGASPAGGVS